MKRTLVTAASLLLACGPSGEQRFEVDVAARNPWTRLEAPDRNRFRFAIVSDRTGLPRAGVFASAIRKLNLLQPDFVMSVGDLVEGYTLEGRITDLERIERDWEYIETLTGELESPFFYTVGNNDINSEEAAPLWESRFGRTYYQFRYRNSFFVVLNSDDPPASPGGSIGETQLDWLSRTLQANTDVNWTFVFLHRPLWANEEVHSDWQAVEALLGDRPRTVFAGHLTKYERSEVDGHSYFMLSSTGSGSEPEQPPSGAFDHVMWVTMTEDGPRVANLMLGGIWGDDPVAEATSR